MSRYEPVIMLIEDDFGDIELAEELLKENIKRLKLVSARSGNEAIDYLKNNQAPDLILLDLNMPGMSGRRLLTEIKSEESLTLIPVIVLSTSANEKDIRESYMNGANCYIRKPMGLDGYRKAARLISDFWFGLAELP